MGMNLVLLSSIGPPENSRYGAHAAGQNSQHRQSGKTLFVMYPPLVKQFIPRESKLDAFVNPDDGQQKQW